MAIGIFLRGFSASPTVTCEQSNKLSGNKLSINEKTHSDQLGSNECKEGVGHHRPKSKKYGSFGIVNLAQKIRSHGTIWCSPIPESDAIMMRISSCTIDLAWKIS